MFWGKFLKIIKYKICILKAGLEEISRELDNSLKKEKVAVLVKEPYVWFLSSPWFLYEPLLVHWD